MNENMKVEKSLKVLFINACMRSKGVSRTYALAHYFLDVYKELNPKNEIAHLDLCTDKLFPLTYYDLSMREKDTWGKQKYAQQFAWSDKIVIAAPVWNQGFPSILNVYLEHICLPGVTFESVDDEFNGLCHGKKALYISTMGRTASLSNTTGAEHIQSALTRLGIDDFEHICAEGLDIKVNDAEVLLRAAMKKCDVLAKTW